MEANATRAAITDQVELRKAVDAVLRAQVALDEIEAERRAETQKIEQAAFRRGERHRRTIETLMPAVEAYCAEHRGELLPAKAKSVQVGGGTVGWSLSPLRVEVENDDQVVAALRKMGRYDLVKVTTTEKPDKSALKKAREAVEGVVAGVSYVQEETFFVKPV